MIDSSPRTRGGVLALAAIPLALHALMAWRLRAAAISTGQDDAVYLLLGRGLRDLAYSNYWLIGNPPHGTYPPLYPLILGGTDALFGSTLAPAVVLNVLFSTGALAILFAVACRWSVPAAFLALSVSAVNPWLVRLAGQLFSEPVYMFFAAATLWCVAVPNAPARSRLGAGAMAMIAFLGRIIGLAMILGVLLQWIVERRFRAAAILAAVSLVCVGGWFVHARSVTRSVSSGQSYLRDVLSTHAASPPARDTLRVVTPDPPDSPAAATPAPVAAAPNADTLRPSSRWTMVNGIPALAVVMVKRVLSNVPAYLTRRIPSVLAFPTLPGTTLDNWLWLGVLVVLGGLGLVELYRRLPAAAFYLGCYAGILLVWPFSLQRYLVPVIPLLLLTLFLGMSRLVGRRGLAAWVLPTVIALALVISGLGQQRGELSAAARCDRSAPYTSEGCFNPVERAFFEAVRYSDSLVPRDSTILSPKMATVYYLTGRRSIDELSVTSLESDALRAYLREREINYVLLSRIHLDQKWISERMQYLCGDWELEKDFGGLALLLRRGTERAPDPSLPACDAISRFAKGPW